MNDQRNDYALTRFLHHNLQNALPFRQSDSLLTCCCDNWQIQGSPLNCERRKIQEFSFSQRWIHNSMTHKYSQKHSQNKRNRKCAFPSLPYVSSHFGGWVLQRGGHHPPCSLDLNRKHLNCKIIERSGFTWKAKWLSHLFLKPITLNRNPYLKSCSDSYLSRLTNGHAGDGEYFLCQKEPVPGIFADLLPEDFLLHILRDTTSVIRKY